VEKRLNEQNLWRLVLTRVRALGGSVRAQKSACYHLGMKTRAFWDLGGVSDQQLRSGLAALLASGYRTEARIIAHIAEVEERRLHSKDGSSSLFEYCMKKLGLSESEAFHRLTAARIARRFPTLFAMIERREIHLSAVCLLRDYLTRENHLELLAEASHKTKFQVQELLARRFPRPDVVSRIRKLPSPVVSAPAHSINGARPANGAYSAEGGASPAEGGASPAEDAPAVAARSPRGAPPSGAPREASIPVVPARASIEPTSEARYRIQLNASAALKEKLELFKALVSHSVPNGDIAAVLERALDLALEQAQKRRFAKTERPRSRRTRMVKRASQHREHREHIPNAVQREVAARDGLRCTYVSEGGCRCSARAFLQIHHEEPWARGGAPTTENLRLLCASHNRLLAERDFGAAHVAERRAARRCSNGQRLFIKARVQQDGASPRTAGQERAAAVGLLSK
jgi:5-methylcytosine-specific restriction endonuclease McrA